MNCPMETGGNAEYLLDFVAGKLNAAARAQMVQHIDACPQCRKFAGSQQAVWQALDDWQPAEVSVDFDRRLFARIEQQPLPWWKRFMAPFDSVMRHAVPVGATAAVVLMASFLIYRPGPAPAPVRPEPSVAQGEQLQPEQVDQALDQMQMLRDFNRLVKPDSADPKM